MTTTTTLTLSITFDTDDPDFAYQDAQKVVKLIEEAEGVESIRVLSGVADND